MLDAVGDPVRRRIVDRLAAGPLAVGEIAEHMPVGRPAISMHLRLLLSAGVVTARRSGNRRLYRLNPDAMHELQEHFRGYWEQAMAAFKDAAEEEASSVMDVKQREEVMTTTTVTVKAPLDVAFRVFAGLRWWPIETHHLAEPPGEEAVLEPFVGGRWYERGPGSREQDWGTVLAWEPPHRILLSWHFSPDWTYEPDPARSSEIEVRFTAAGPDQTLVVYSHRHLERYGEEAAERMRLSVDGGAARCLATYAAAMAAADRS
jgi:DNA-binding transcriptional ArsR family regulator/uncharacterized protein YndB with AHSA1/START domain